MGVYCSINQKIVNKFVCHNVINGTSVTSMPCLTVVVAHVFGPWPTLHYKGFYLFICTRTERFFFTSHNVSR